MGTSPESATTHESLDVTIVREEDQLHTLVAARLEAQGLSSADMGRVADAIGSVWDNRDELMDVLEWFRENRERVMGLLQKLPDLVSSAGDGIGRAGESAVSAAKFLVGGDGDDEFSAADLARTAADALDRCREELADARELIAKLGDEIDDVRIPSVTPKYVKVAGLKVISGLDIGEQSLTDSAADRLRNGAARIGGVSDGLETVSEQLRRLGGAVTDAGANLESVGGFLSESGLTLSNISQGLFGDDAPVKRQAVGPQAPKASADMSSVPSAGLGSGAASGRGPKAAAKKPTAKSGTAKAPAAKRSTRKTPPK